MASLQCELVEASKSLFRSIDAPLPHPPTPPVCSLMASLIELHRLARQLIRPQKLMALQFSTTYIFD